MRKYLFEAHRKTVFMYLDIEMFRSHNVASVNLYIHSQNINTLFISMEIRTDNGVAEKHSRIEKDFTYVKNIFSYIHTYIHLSHIC